MTGTKDDKQEPTIAIALGYDQADGEAPTVLAKGHGELARHIVETAEQHGVTIEENPVLAAALSRVELDETIPEELYTAVAQVISYVLRQTGQLS